MKIAISVDDVAQQVRALRSLADGLPSPAVVEQTEGLKGVPTAQTFEKRMTGLARTFGTQANLLVGVLEQHADRLRAAIDELGAADQNGQTVLSTLDAVAAAQPEAKSTAGQDGLS
ncbi:hypothetical protein [Xylanimonas allomyrinae]|uniref:hypothetical protein n=1 Tax=Xylanimonas allomyrinae TaxID=2509459 RepID=UPI0013A5FD2C|nr:hypothetical protein [Xylanimonas allomyrinae]